MDRQNPHVTRNALGHWQAGSAANPGGRPKGLASRIRAMTDDGNALIEIMVEIATAKRLDGTPLKPTPAYRDRCEAVKYLTERAYGKALETTAVVNLTREDLDDPALSSEALTELARAVRARQALVAAPIIEAEFRLETSPNHREQLTLGL